MILEEETYKKFGYWPRELSKGSHKKILIKCIQCGKIREYPKYGYSKLCKSCAHKGLTAWNKGLTKETDERVKIASEHMKGHKGNSGSDRK